MMRLSYAIKFDDFQTLQPPLPAAKGATAGFKGVLVACALIAFLGVFLMLQGMGLQVGLFLIGLGLAAATGAYFYEQHSLSKNKENHAKRLAAEFQRIHCRDERIFTADESGFTASCKCGTVTRPWSELTSFSENKTHFAFNTKMGGHILPKSAFPSEAEITEFRVLATGKLHHDKPATAPHFDFALKSEDYRAAYWTHTLKGGGWRGLAKVAATYSCFTWGVFVIWNSMAVHNDGVRAALIGGLIGFPLLRLTSRKRRQYLGPMRVHFSNEGLYLQDPANQARTAWNQYVGYLEGNGLFLLYFNPKLYRIIPKRALTGHAAQFQTLVQTKLTRYDYKSPNPALETKTAG